MTRPNFAILNSTQKTLYEPGSDFHIDNFLAGKVSAELLKSLAVEGAQPFRVPDTSKYGVLSKDSYKTIDALCNFVLHLGERLDEEQLHQLTSQAVKMELTLTSGDNTFMRRSTLAKYLLAYEIQKYPKKAEEHFWSPENPDAVIPKKVVEDSNKAGTDQLRDHMLLIAEDALSQHLKWALDNAKDEQRESVSKKMIAFSGKVFNRPKKSQNESNEIKLEQTPENNNSAQSAGEVDTIARTKFDDVISSIQQLHKKTNQNHNEADQVEVVLTDDLKGAIELNDQSSDGKKTQLKSTLIKIYNSVKLPADFDKKSFGFFALHLFPPVGIGFQAGIFVASCVMWGLDHEQNPTPWDTTKYSAGLLLKGTVQPLGLLQPLRKYTQPCTEFAEQLQEDFESAVKAR